MAAGAPQDYTFDHEVHGDGRVTFRCSQDREAWPWLELPACHPVAMQTINYWASVESSIAQGTHDPGKWTALTWMDWECGDPGDGKPARGVMDTAAVQDDIGFALTFFDEADRLLYRSRGKGVVFRTRNFEGWRSEAKRRVHQQVALDDFDFAERASVGVSSEEFALVSPLQSTGSIYADALVTADNGLPPANRFMSGSGDHVNATHLAEVGRQFAALLTGDPDQKLQSGEISFLSYVELGAPFRITLNSRMGVCLKMAVQQGDKLCTELTLNIASS